MWYAHLDLGVVGDGGLTVFGRHRHLEDAEAVLGHGRGIAVPAVKVADEECTHGIGRPLAVHDVAIGLDVEAVDLVALQERSAWESNTKSGRSHSRELLQAALGLVNCLDPFLCFGEAAPQRASEGLKVAVELHDAWTRASANCSHMDPQVSYQCRRWGPGRAPRSESSWRRRC
jgi:hypothetical protein